AQSPDRRERWNGAAGLNDLAHCRDGGGGGAPLPFVLKRGRRDLTDSAGLFHQRAHAGGVTGLEPASADPADVEVGDDAAAPPPPLKGGGCSTGCHSF